MSNIIPSETPNVVIENPKVRKGLRTVIDTIGGVTFIVAAADAVSDQFDVLAYTVPIMAAYTAARVVFGFVVDNTNTPKQ